MVPDDQRRNKRHTASDAIVQCSLLYRRSCCIGHCCQVRANLRVCSTFSRRSESHAPSRHSPSLPPLHGLRLGPGGQEDGRPEARRSGYGREYRRTTLGFLPQPFERWGIKFAATYIGEALGNMSGGLKGGSVYKGRLNLAVDADLEKLAGLRELTFHANMFQTMACGRTLPHNPIVDLWNAAGCAS